MINKKITPSSDDLGQRLDRYLRKIFPGARLGEIYEALRTKKITIGGKKLPENTRLREGDILDTDLSEEILRDWKNNENTQYKIQNTTGEKLDISRILYEDTDLLIYDKPAGLIVHSPDHKTDEVSLIEQIEEYLISKGWKPAGTFAHPALAHRIDRDTSGIIISCLTRRSYEHMAEQFRTRKVEKTYLALVAGTPETLEGIITAPLLRLDTGRTDEAKMVVDKLGQTAETSYKVLTHGKTEKMKNGNTWSLIELHPKTGRTHQIRVHMAHIRHPLIGDKRYGGKSLTQFPELFKMKEGGTGKNNLQLNIEHGTLNIGSRHGHLLHAYQIAFVHPNGKEMEITSPRTFF